MENEKDEATRHPGDNKVAVSPERVRTTYQFHDLGEILMTGQLTESRLREEVARYAEDHDMVLGEIKYRWSLEVDTLGVRFPEELTEDLDPEDDRDAEEITRIRDQFRSSIQAALCTTNLRWPLLFSKWTKGPFG